MAVNLGDDADTTGAVYGQIGGVFYGVEGIPEGGREKLTSRDRLDDLATQLMQTRGASSPS
jgi:ADP-ribosyl-[dinitrogen reductase] hydrolase